MREQGIRWATVLGLLLLTLSGATAQTVQHVTPQSMRHGRMTLGEMASRPLPDLPLSARSAPPPTSPLALLPVPGVGGGGLLGPFLRQFGPGAGGATPPALTQGFDGIGYTGWIPPDTMGAVGPAHICMIVNGGFSVHNKTTGALISEVELTQFFDSVRSSAFVFDPKIFYDQYSQRWFAVALDYNFGVPNTSFMLVATSASSDPTQAWFLWAIDADVDGLTQRDTWADYPGFGYDQDGVYLSGNMFSQTTGSFQYVKVWGLPKQQMIDGEAVLNWYEASNLPGFTWQPASHFGVGQGGFFVFRESNASLRVAQFVGLLGTPALLD